MAYVILGVLTPTRLPISFKMTKPYGTSSQKNLALVFNLTKTFSFFVFSKSYPGTGSIGNGTLVYPRLVLNILLSEEVSLIWPWYIVLILS